MSGGERQRISIARAILKNAPIVIFDEATASIDPDNESDIQLAIDSLATVYKGNIIKNLIMDCQSYTKYRPNETTGGIFVSWRRKEELPTGLD